MNANYDDPKYTAYVLGELDDAEGAAIEAELRDDPALAAAVAEIRAATERLAQVLQAEHLPKWRAGQLAALLAVADGAAVNGRELNGSSLAAASPSPPAPLPSRERGEQRNGEVEVAGNKEVDQSVVVASRPRRLSWRGRVIAVATLATAGGLMIALWLPTRYRNDDSSQQVSRATVDELSRENLGLNNRWSRTTGPQTIDGFDTTLSLIVEEEGGQSGGAEGGVALKKSITGAEFQFRQQPGKNDYVVTTPAPDSRNNILTKLHTLSEGEQVLPTVNRYVQPESGARSTSGSAIQNKKEDKLNAAYRQDLGTVTDGTAKQPSNGPVATPIPVSPNFGIEAPNGYYAGDLKRGEALKQQTAGGEARAKQQDQPPQDGQPQPYRYAGTKPDQNGEVVDKSRLSGVDKSKWKEGGERARESTADPYELPALQGREKDKELADSRQLPFGDVDGLSDGFRGGRGVGGGVPGDFGRVVGPDGTRRTAWFDDFDHNTEAYDYVNDNPFLGSGENPLSTFSIDVDTASYSNIRRFLMQQHRRPPRGAVRIEELVNYFRYDYPQPEGDKPFSVTTEVASCPWEPEHRLVRIGLKGREIPQDKRPPSNLVFLIDVSGSMNEPNKLPLVKQSLKLLAEQLGENDKVSMVVYAGNSGLVLPSTRGDSREAILDAIDRLNAGGSTNGAQGIELAYEIATNNLIPGKAVNRVILATDGDFNVGATSRDELIRLIEEKAKTGVFLTTLGYGMGNIKDSTLEQLADKGNGSYAYIDDLGEARKVLVEEMVSTLVPIAKDVKIQVEFNPAEVASYRLIGYENRVLAKEDFNDDRKDAGEIGAGHTVTALYEVTPVAKGDDRAEGRKQKAEGEDKLAADEKLAEGKESAGKPVSGAANGPPADAGATIVDSLKYQQPAKLSEAAKTGELFTLKLRYKQPDGDKSTLIETPVKDAGKKYREASADFKFAAAVASFGMILRNSPFKGNANIAAIEELAGEGVVKKDDKQQTDASYRAEFMEMVKQAKALGAP